MRRVFGSALCTAMLVAFVPQNAAARDDRGAEIMLDIIQGVIEDRARRREDRRARRYEDWRRDRHYPRRECFYDRYGNLRFCR